MISIILATYNGSLYLEDQLKSLMNQTVRADEVIIVDDCSTDGTVEIITRFRNDNKDVNINLILNEYNIGPARAFAKGVLESRGDLVFFCDQDDIWFENKIEEMVNIFEKNPQVKMLCTGYHLYDDNNKKVIKHSKGSGDLSKVSLRKILKGNISPGCTVAFRGIYRDKAELITENIFIHDWFYTVICAVDNGLYYYCKPLIYYRIHNNNTIGKNLSLYPKYTREKRIKSIRQHIRFYDELVKLGIFNAVEDSNKIKSYLDSLIKINNLRVDLLKGYIGYSSYLKNLYSLGGSITIKSIVGDIVYARKKD